VAPPAVAALAPPLAYVQPSDEPSLSSRGAVQPSAVSEAAASDPLYKPWAPYAGFSLTHMRKPAELADGDGADFSVRVGPAYNRHGKKAPSAKHVYEPRSIDVFKGSKIRYRLFERMNLHPPPDAALPNDTGLPRRLVVNTIIPAEAPKLMGQGFDGPCYQMVLTFTTTAERLRQWKASGSAACDLFQRFYDESTTDPPTIAMKERWKLLAKIDNMKQLGLNMFERYNGKPALITKSGSMHRADDLLEVAMNTFRFGLITRRGVWTLLPRLPEMNFHFAVTVEGRDEDHSLPEQVLAAVRVKKMDFISSAIDPGDFTGFV